MNQYKIVAICQIYNELKKENLKRFFKYLLPLVSSVIVYDDGSTDGSYEYAKEQTPFVIRNEKNEFESEIEHKQVLIQKAKELKADFILWLDADEVLSTDDPSMLQKLCSYIEEKKIDGLSFHEINLWRSTSWQRVDSLYDIGWFVRLWKVTENMKYKIAKKGLHQKQYPATINIIEKTNEIKVIHYGFSSEKQLANKYMTYKSCGQRGFDLDRLINEDNLTLTKVFSQLFPKGLWRDDSKPKKLSFINALSYVEKYRIKPKLLSENTSRDAKVKITAILHPIFYDISISKNVKIVKKDLIHTINPSNTDVLFLDNSIKNIAMPFIYKVLYIPKESIYNEKVQSDKNIVSQANIIFTDSLEVVSFYRDFNVYHIPKRKNERKVFWQNLFYLIYNKIKYKEKTKEDTSIKLNVITKAYQARKLYNSIVINFLKQTKHILYINFFK